MKDDLALLIRQLRGAYSDERVFKLGDPPPPKETIRRRRDAA